MTPEITGYCHRCGQPVYHNVDDHDLIWCALCGMEDIERELIEEQAADMLPSRSQRTSSQDSTQSSISEARMSEPTIFIVRGHTSTCECRIDDCFVEVEEPVYRKCQRCQGRAGWTEPNTLEWVECEAPGCDFGVVEIGGDENG